MGQPKVGLLELDQLESNKHVIALFRIGSIDGLYNTIGKIACGKKLNKADKQYYINFINDVLSLKSNNYEHIAVKKVIISFGVRDGLALAKKTCGPF